MRVTPEDPVRHSATGVRRIRPFRSGGLEGLLIGGGTFLGVWLLSEPARGDAHPGKAARRYAAVVAALLLVAISQQVLAPFATGRASRFHFPAQQLAARVDSGVRKRSGRCRVMICMLRCEKLPL